MDVRLANPRGFCAGVDRAIDIVNRALEVFGAPIYVRHEVVHNKFVVEDLRARGALTPALVEQRARLALEELQRMASLGEGPFAERRPGTA